jgi:hypothetical protein
MRRFLSLILLAACSETTPVAPDGEADAGVPDAGGLRLQPGEVAQLAVGGDGTAGERLATPTGAEQFVLILASTRFDLAEDDLVYSVALDGEAHAGPTTLVTDCSLSSAPWGTPPPVDPPPDGTPPLQGSTRSIDMPTPSGVVTIEAQALAVGAHAVVWVDTTDPTTLDAAFVAQFLDDFENVIMPRERTVFGTEPDFDGDGCIDLVFSPLTYQTAVAFFTGCDLLDTLAGCPTSNHGEFLYLTPPDAIDPPYNTPKAIKEILAHETSHLLHFTRKVLDNGLGFWPDSGYMIEGVGGFAQDVSGYQAGNLYVTMAGLDGIEQFSLADTLVDERPYDLGRDGVLRGGSYLFVRFLYDRAGGDAVDGADVQSRGGPALLRALIDEPRSMAEALPDVTAAGTADIAADFYTALAMSNRDVVGSAAPTNPCFAYRPTVSDPVTTDQRGANLFASFHGMRMDGPFVGDAAAPDGGIRLGGVELLQLDARPGEPDIALSVQVDPAAAPRVRVGRWK